MLASKMVAYTNNSLACSHLALQCVQWMHCLINVKSSTSSRIAWINIVTATHIINFKRKYRWIVEKNSMRKLRQTGSIG